MNTYLIPTTCYRVVIATSICWPLWAAVTLHRLQGEILNYPLQVGFTALSTRYTLVNICKANERSSSQCCACFGCRSVSILQGEIGTGYHVRALQTSATGSEYELHTQLPELSMGCWVEFLFQVGLDGMAMVDVSPGLKMILPAKPPLQSPTWDL